MMNGLSSDGATILHLRAKNDVNGNPRRVYLRLPKGRGVDLVADEGYAGNPFTESRDISLDVSVKDYKRWITYGREHGILYHEGRKLE